MTTEQINVALAQRMGLVCSRCNGTGSYLKHGPHAWARMWNYQSEIQPEVKCEHFEEDFLPDYCGDLNAIHAVVKGMNAAEYAKYQRRLRLICADDFYEHKTHWTPSSEDATAEQPARAAVHAFGLEGA